MAVTPKISFGDLSYYLLDTPTPEITGAKKGDLAICKTPYDTNLFVNADGANLWHQLMVNNVFGTAGHVNDTQNYTPTIGQWVDHSSILTKGDCNGFDVVNNNELKIEEPHYGIFKLIHSASMDPLDNNYMGVESGLVVNDDEFINQEPTTRGGCSPTYYSSEYLSDAHSCLRLMRMDGLAGSYAKIRHRQNRNIGYSQGYKIKNANINIEVIDGGICFYKQNWEDITKVNWSNANDSTNEWVIGTGAVNQGTYALYISNDGSTNAYSNVANVSHLWRDIRFPASIKNVYLALKCKVDGDPLNRCVVSLVPTSVTPVAGTELNSSYKLKDLYDILSWEGRQIFVDPSLYTEGQTYRLVLSWVNDTSTVKNPPIAIDEMRMWGVLNQ